MFINLFIKNGLTAAVGAFTPGISVLNRGLCFEFHAKGIFDMESEISMEVIIYVMRISHKV